MAANGKPKDLIYQSKDAMSKAIELRTLAWSYERIAQYLNAVEQPEIGLEYTASIVKHYLEDAGVPKDMATTKAASRAVASAEAREMIVDLRLKLKREVDMALAGGLTAKDVKAIADSFYGAYDRALNAEGIGPTPAGGAYQGQAERGRTEAEKEEDAFRMACREEFAKDPTMFERIKKRTLDILAGAVSVPGAIDVTPSVINHQPNAPPDDHAA